MGLFLLLFICGIGKVVFCDIASNISALEGPAEATKTFYAWYMHQLNQNIYPLDKNREEMKQYVTGRLIQEIDQMPKGPEGLNGDYFVDAQEWDSEWEKNIVVSKVTIEGEQAKADLVLSGPKNPDHKLRVNLVRENKIWKIDKVETGTTDLG